MTINLKPVRQDLIGEAVSATIPSDDQSLYGAAELHGPKVAEVRTWQTFRLIYTTGKLGIDDTGGIRIAFRFISDAGFLQTTDPVAPNYVSARSNGGGRLELKYDRIGGQRPWNETLTVYQRGGYLKPGEQIEITFGDTSGGSSGLLMPTFFDSGRVFRVMADVQATGVYVPLDADPLYVSVVAGPLDRYRTALPTLRRPDEVFHLGLKAEDIWGNPTSQGPTQFQVTANMAVKGLPETIDFDPENGAMTFEGLQCSEEGTLNITLRDATGQDVVAGPMVIAKSDVAHFWGDLHGQTGETVGTNTIEHYFDFARNKSFLDVTSHQANDFQVTAKFWAHLNDLTAKVDEPGRFTVLPGYEWSGNTAVGGDHNVFFMEEGAPIFRCSHALVQDRADSETDAHTLTDLYAKLQAEPTESVMYAHVGGRYANIFYDHDATLEAAVEMHSAWGSFEWILTDGFPLRRRVGVVCNSDGHKGRPGASYPGASVFGAYGGLTCFVTSENTRASIFETIRRRHTYGTTGPRVYLDVSAQLPDGGTLFHRNPDAVADTTTEKVDNCILGDIVRCEGDTAQVSVTINAPVGIVGVELRDGVRVLRNERTFGADELGSRYRLMWSGAEYRGRGRNTAWHGRATLSGGRIDALEPVNKLNPEMRMQQTGSAAVVWDSVTTGNMMGFDLRLTKLEDDASLAIATNHGDLEITLSNVGLETQVLDAGGLERKLEVMRLPDVSLPKSVSFNQVVSIAETGDTPIWVCVTLEDGNQVWSSPMYLFRD